MFVEHQFLGRNPRKYGLIEVDLAPRKLQFARVGMPGEQPMLFCVAKEGRAGGKAMKWAKFTGPSGNTIWYELESGVAITEATESERGRFGAERVRTIISRAGPLMVRETLDQVATALGAKNDRL